MYKIEEDIKTSGFSAMGKPIPSECRERGYKFCQENGLDVITAGLVIQVVARDLEHDSPQQAMKTASVSLGVVSAYRLFAILLTDSET